MFASWTRRFITIANVCYTTDREILNNPMDDTVGGPCYPLAPHATLRSEEDTKGARRMPWHRKSTKDAASCDKLGGGANTRYHPEVSEWGNPAGPIPCYLPPESIGRQGTTRGTETSKYPEEEKSTEIARVAASESAPAQTRARVSGRRCRPGVAGRTCGGCPPA